MSEHIVSPSSKEKIVATSEELNTLSQHETHSSHTKRHENQKQPAESLEAIRRKIERQTASQEKPAVKEQTKEATPTTRVATKRIKTERYQLTMSQVRGHLSPTQKLASKIVHQPFIEAASEIGSKTIARPSGLLGGGLTALIGSLGIIIVAKRVGFEVPNSIFWVLFLIGFLLGMAIEFLFRKLKKRKAYSSNF
jgi:hypothetical protein